MQTNSSKYHELLQTLNRREYLEAVLGKPYVVEEADVLAIKFLQSAFGFAWYLCSDNFLVFRTGYPIEKIRDWKAIYKGLNEREQREWAGDQFDTIIVDDFYGDEENG